MYVLVHVVWGLVSITALACVMICVVVGLNRRRVNLKSCSTEELCDELNRRYELISQAFADDDEWIDGEWDEDEERDEFDESDQAQDADVEDADPAPNP